MRSRGAWRGYSAKRGTKESDVERQRAAGQDPTGTYPVSADDDAYQYDRNPNSIQPASPSPSCCPRIARAAKKPSCLPFGAIGYATRTACAIFNALDGQGRDAVAHEVLDALRRPSRADRPVPLPRDAAVPDAGATARAARLIGYALDGFRSTATAATAGNC